MSDNIATDLSLESFKKTRGRPKGSIREVYFVIAALSGEDLISEQIRATRGEEISEDEMRLEAKEIFSNQYNLEPISVFGPFFEAKLSQNSSTATKRETYRIPEEDVNYTNRKVSATFNGWEVVGRYIEDDLGVERSDIVEVSFKKELMPGNKPKAKPQRHFRPLSDLTN